MLLGVEIHLTKRELRLHAKLVGVRLQVCIQLGVGRLGLGGTVIGDELHLLRQAATDDDVVLVEAERQCLAVKYFLAHPALDQFLQFFSGGRPLTGPGEALDQGLELSLRDHNLAQLVVPAGFGHQAVRDEKPSSQQEEMQQWLSKNSLHDWTGEKRGSGAQNSLLSPFPDVRCLTAYTRWARYRRGR